MRLGIIDWGIGGISIYKLIKDRIGDVAVTYFSDTGVTPYGRMSRSELSARLNAVIAYLRSKGVTHIAIGCNAASTVIGEIDPQGTQIIGVIEPAIEMTARLKPKRLGMIGGRRTVFSGIYRRAFVQRGIEVRQRIAQPLSALIESGDVTSDVLRSESRRILSPIRNCSHILLACTHYPAITPILREFVSPETQFIDPAGEVVKLVTRWRIPVGGSDEFLTTGDAASMKRSADKAFGVKIAKARKLR